MKERVVYLNGQLVPESEASISIFSPGLWSGRAVFDVARTFRGEPFKLKEHIERLYKSCRYARIDPDVSPEEMHRISLQVLQANLDPVRIRENNDYEITQMVIQDLDSRPTVAVFCSLLTPKFQWKASMFRDGARLVTPSNRHVPPECVDPKVKFISRVWIALGGLEARHIDPHCWTLLLDLNGNISEAGGANFFIVSQGVLLTPGPRNILLGISRQTVLELAEELNIPAIERDIQVYDVYNADEAFLTQESSCILPVCQLNGIQIGEKIPGPITKRLLDAWSAEVGVDIAGQHLNHLRET